MIRRFDSDPRLHHLAGLGFPPFRFVGGWAIHAGDLNFIQAKVHSKLGPVVKNMSTNYAGSSSSSGGGSSGCACDVSTRTRNQLGTGLLIMGAMFWIRRRRRAV